MQPFLIAPFTHGLDTDLSPWLLPENAFSEIVNGHIHHGVLEKREGNSTLGRISHCLALSSASAVDPAVFGVSDTTNIADDDEVQLNYLLGGTWSTLEGSVYTVDNVIANTSFTLKDSDDVAISGAGLGTWTSGCVSFYPGSRVMGLERYIDSSNIKQLLAFDLLRASIFNSITELFDPLDQSAIFSSGNTDFISSTNWSSVASTVAAPLFRMYFTNGKSNGGTSTDGLRVYDPAIKDSLGNSSVTGQFNPLINSTTEIRGCKLVFAFRERLVLLHTFEGSNTFPQRCRWSQTQTPGGTGATYPLTFGSEWDDNVAGKGGFVDAPTGEQIISAQFIQNQIIVFFTESVWTLRPTSDPALPFRWDKINDFRACAAKMGSASFDRYVTAVGTRGITATDGVETKRWDQRIEDFVDDNIYSNEMDKVFSRRSFGNRRLWTLYPSGTSDNPDKALIYDEESGAFSTYEIALNALGYGGVSKDFTLADFSDPVDYRKLPVTIADAEDDELNSFVWTKGAEIFLGGNRSGEVLTLETGGSDGSSSINFKVVSAAWNPWKDEGAQAQMGYLDLFVSTDQNAVLLYEFFKNNDQTPYLSIQGDLLPNLTEKSEIGTISKASPGSVRSPSHGLTTDDIIFIYKVKGMVEVNGESYTVTVVDEDTFTIGVDTSAFTTYTTGGVITENAFAEGKTWKRVYAGGTGYQHKVQISSSGIDEPIRIHAFMPWFRKTGGRLV